MKSVYTGPLPFPPGWTFVPIHDHQLRPPANPDRSPYHLWNVLSVIHKVYNTSTMNFGGQAKDVLSQRIRLMLNWAFVGEHSVVGWDPQPTTSEFKATFSRSWGLNEPSCFFIFSYCIVSLGYASVVMKACSGGWAARAGSYNAFSSSITHLFVWLFLSTQSQ